MATESCYYRGIGTIKVNTKMTSIIDEWSDKSKKGELCGVLGCGEKPTTMCAICFRHYCYQDLITCTSKLTKKEKS